MADVPFGVLLSGGLDSSLVASVIARLRRKRFLERGDPRDLEPLKSFSIGLEGSPDLKAAKAVAESIGTEHYGFTFTVQEGIDATTPAGKLQMHILGAIAEFERARIRERVLAGLQRARREGRRLGRPRARPPVDALRRVAGLSVDSRP